MTWGSQCPQCGKIDCRWAYGDICEGQVIDLRASLTLARQERDEAITMIAQAYREKGRAEARISELENTVSKNVRCSFSPGVCNDTKCPDCGPLVESSLRDKPSTSEIIKSLDKLLTDLHEPVPIENWTREEMINVTHNTISEIERLRTLLGRKDPEPCPVCDAIRERHEVTGDGVCGRCTADAKDRKDIADGKN